MNSTTTDLFTFQENKYTALKRYWGYSSFRELQEEAIDCVLRGKDSLVVLPTGGGKSLCFQLPAVLKEGLTVVISPLISLMKDQVDSLNDIGIGAQYLNSTQDYEQQKMVIQKIHQQEVSLLYISPERLLTQGTLNLLQSIPLNCFVIDEAHCISHWGHSFREDYRNLTKIKEVFPHTSIHAFTATATKQVQEDIIQQLRLNNSSVYVGNVDRPNLTYRVAQRSNIIKQIIDIIDKHPKEAGIIYCLKRSDVEDISRKLNIQGIRNLPYHAGFSDQMRHDYQDKFAREEVDIIVATVAFGMGIDRSNIRFVIHAAMPKSIEHFQQETGRAGRDGLPASCYMLYGGNDFKILNYFLMQSSDKQVMQEKLSLMYDFCATPDCRHKVLTEYFGQKYEKTSCNACDYCLGEMAMEEDTLDISRKIIITVLEIRGSKNMSFGAGHIANILKGSRVEQVLKWRHDELGVYNTFADKTITYIRSMIEQLIGQGFLERGGEYNTLSVPEKGLEVLGGTIIPKLAKPLERAKKKDIAKKRKAKKQQDWEGIDQDLFEQLREKRMLLARQYAVPAYIIFGDKTLKDMALKKPTTHQEFGLVFGVGQSKLEKYADEFLPIIQGIEE